jgi:uncharacterized lipoprotein
MRRALVIATAAVLVLSACGADSRTGAPGATTPSSGSPAATTDSTPAPSVPVGSGDPATAPEALRFTAPAVGGGTLDLATYAGQTVAFWFWAPT